MGITVLGGFPGGTYVNCAIAADVDVRMTTGLRAASQCMSWLASESGMFRKNGLAVSFPKLEVGGPEAAIGMTRGDWDFCQTGTLPIAEGVLNGRDPVILLRNAAPHVGLFVMTRREITSLDQLAGKRVGVLTDAFSGQTGVNTRRTLEKAGVTATYPGLGTYENIFAAMASGDIEAGAAPIHLRFLGERQHGWHAFPMDSLDLPSVFATTRRMIASNRDVVARAVRGMIEAVHLFKTRPDITVPLLQRFLDIGDRASAEDLHNYYVPLFSPDSKASLGDGMQGLRETFANKYPAVQKMQESDIVDSSFIDELEQSGFIKKLYAGKVG
jgi:ABC-type nitrate/sulfonate/bicarbonate transport system substrate-binding protein